MILGATLHNKRFKTEAFPHIDPEVFEDPAHNRVFKLLHSYVLNYGEPPAYEALKIELGEAAGLSEGVYQDCQKLVDHLYSEKFTGAIQSIEESWLFKTSESYCKDRSIWLAIMKSVAILEDEKQKLSAGAIPEILQKALATSFHNKIGHDFIEDAMERYDFYHVQVPRVVSKFKMVNQVTKGGYPNKSLNLFVAPTGVGKTIYLCNEAAHALEQGHNVIYFTMEMAEEQIARRIDAILMDVELDDLDKMPRSTYEKKIQRIRDKTKGKLIIQEFSPGSASAANLRFALQELKQKKDFKPTIIIVDYLNLLQSSRLKFSAAGGSYMYVKYIAEELRALGFEFECPVLSATQTNRSAQGATDFDMTQTSDSHGTNMTADFILAGISNDQLEQMKQIRFKLLKNRYGPLDNPGTWLQEILKSKMQILDLENPYPARTTTPGSEPEPSAGLPQHIQQNRSIGKTGIQSSRQKFGQFTHESATMDMGDDDVPWAP